LNGYGLTGVFAFLTTTNGVILNIRTRKSRRHRDIMQFNKLLCIYTWNSFKLDWNTGSIETIHIFDIVT
jgi:hypothetical protein